MSELAADPNAAVARLYLDSHHNGVAVVNLPGTDYRVHLQCEQKPDPTPQGRIRGRIECTAWKVDQVTRGGSYIEPIYGTPRRIQGKVLASDPKTNSIVLDVAGQPVLGLLPSRWEAAQMEAGRTLALDVAPGARFIPEQRT